MEKMLNALIIGSPQDDLALLDDCLNEHKERTVKIDYSESVQAQDGPAETPPYDIVFIDMDIHGVKALEDLRAINGSSSDLPVIILSSKEKESAAMQALNKGAKDYILKENISRELLLSSIRHSVKRTEIEHELRDAKKIKSKFISMISHELRTPLTAVKESVRILEEHLSAGLSSDQLEIVSLARRNIEKLEKIVSDMLDFQKIEAGELNIEKVTFDLLEIVENARRVVLPLADEKGLKLVIEKSGDIPLFEFDRDRIEQVVFNLLDNAIKYSDRGIITILLKHDGNTVIVSVSDDGAGIGPDYQDVVFQDFEQIEDLNDRKSGGTGLGLAICREIIECHGGRIWVDSSEGMGSRFSFLLPLVERRRH
ncbi:MAG: HAMP domain-containing histidine kinase [Bacteroidales bacterium]|nr:HAMP domain-containing histidine kinase [Candidatus Latescibacterota bacterium]